MNKRLLFVITCALFFSCANKEKKEKKVEWTPRADSAKQVETFDPGVIIEIEQGLLTARLATVSRKCLNPITPTLHSIADTTISLNDIIVTIKNGRATANYVTDSTELRTDTGIVVDLITGKMAEY